MRYFQAMVTASYTVLENIAHISSNLIGRKLTNTSLSLVIIYSQLYHFLKKTWQGDLPAVIW
jgi:hypothetical protein